MRCPPRAWPLAAVFPALALCVSPLSAQTERATHLIYQFDGPNLGAWADLKVRGAGDIDQDGYADIIVGAPKDGTNGSESGRVDVISGRDGSLLYRFEGFKKKWDRFGWSVDGGRDVNLDGHPDFAIGAWGHDKNGSKSGAVQVFSGKTGKVLWTFYGDSQDDYFGESVRLIGDMNRDGRAEIAVGAPQNYKGKGYVRIFSGSTGKVLLTVRGSYNSGTFGHGLATLEDINFDLKPDFAIGAPGESSNGKNSGSLYIFSGTGKLLKRITGKKAGENFGWHVDAVGDVNRDGRPDIITGAPFANAKAGYAEVLSGADFRTLHRVSGKPGDELGRTVSHVGDLDRDGNWEFAVGTHPASGPGYVLVMDGKSGKQLMRFVGKKKSDGFGWWIGGPGDVNGDGTPDIAVSIHGRGNGSIEVYSGKRLDLSTDKHALSISKSQKQVFTLSGGTPNAYYFVTGSLSDTRPGTWIAGTLIPLNLNGDIYFPLTLEYPNGPFLKNNLGTFDSKGRATAAFITSPVSAPLLGLRIDHAWVEFGGNLLKKASNPVPLRLVP